MYNAINLEECFDIKPEITLGMKGERENSLVRWRKSCTHKEFTFIDSVSG